MSKIRYFILFIVLIIGILLSTNLFCKESNSKNLDETANLNITLSAWLVDWTYKNSISETKNMLEGVDELYLFTTYFDASNNLYQTSESEKLLEAIFNDGDFSSKEHYLTIINDQFREDGTTIQKNPELLKKLLDTQSSREQHIEQIINHAEQYNFTGVEIDYEKIPSDYTARYITFLTELKTALSKENLQLRVVLEPRFPIDQYPLPSDISYIVMAYNLYGYHSGPGPKADFNFLNTLVKKFPNKDGNIGIALATGGFSWTNEKVVGLTEQQIDEIISQKKPKLNRDSASASVYFSFEEDGQTKTVWYADAETINSWVNYLNTNGQYTYFSIWRTGGLSSSTIKLLNDM